MRSIPTVAIILSKNYQTKSGKYSVKLRLTYQRQSKYFKTGYFLTTKEFEKSYLSSRPKGVFADLRQKLQEIEFKARNFVSSTQNFSLEDFEVYFYGRTEQENDVVHYYSDYIAYLIENERYGNARAYKYSLKSFQKFIQEVYRLSSVEFCKISVKFLNRFESWMSTKGLSQTTIGMYMRCLRYVINEGIRNGLLAQASYPFGQEKYGLYSIPKGNNTKKALSLKDLNAISSFDLSLEPNLAFCRDFWMMSFYCGGINFADLLRLRVKDYNGKSISFIREKTRRTKDSASRTILQLTDNAIHLIECYKTDSGEENDYLFEILHKESNSIQNKLQVDNFNNRIRKGMHRISSLLDLPVKVTPIMARHSFANLSWNKKVPISYIADSMSHSSIKTTSSYLKSISDENKIETMTKIFEDF